MSAKANSRRSKSQASNPSIKKILVCNRGEIAIRVFRACSELGIQTVAIYSYEDRLSLHRHKADEAYQVGQPGAPIKSYLDIPGIIRIAQDAAVDAIHPGYGFLSERIELRQAAEAAGIIFIGPDDRTLDIAGDKVKTLGLARSLKVPTVPGSEQLASFEAAQKFAGKVGYPLIFKASFGGGGRGMRVVKKAADLEESFLAARAEAEAAFGKGDVYLEKFVTRPKHIEVQLLGDGSGNVVHLYERDCSVQRRHQKVVEVAPAVSLSSAQKKKLYTYALRLAKSLKLKSAATAEFLVSDKGKIFFIEINPRIQVEHTVTEEITGIDIVQSQIRIASGASLSQLGLTQSKIQQQGVAIQCRLTTEDLSNGFKPDCGKLVTYRSASGFGIRLDAGSAFTGAVISPYYDSLLVKITGRGRTIDEAAAKLRRCLHEFRVRGVKTNIQFLDKLLAHAAFLKADVRTDFIEKTPELFDFEPSRDRANRILRFLAEITVNGHASMPTLKRMKVERMAQIPSLGLETLGHKPPKGWRDVLKQQGMKKFLDRVRNSQALLITDTTFRDAHQSLLATRVRTHDLLSIAKPMAYQLPQLFSLEMWGGATFDVCLRFLKEDPWERLALLRQAVPNILFQMLVRGANVVGYKNYPKNVVQEFIRQSAQSGIDIFRIFDCFNNVALMRSTIDAVKQTSAIAEVCLCYTGDVYAEEQNSKSQGKFNLKYYLDLARQIEQAGADMIAIKDMAGLLRPYAAEMLIRELRQVTDLPIHFHSHDTAGGQIASYLKAAESGVHVVDCAISSMSGVTSQPSLEGLVAALAHTPRDSGLTLEALTPYAAYWENVRGYYASFESDLKAATGEVYLNEIPGGQYSNFRPQAESLGLGDRWNELKQAYREVNHLLGGVVKVTPSSKAIGDFALFMVANDLSAQDVLERAEQLNFPASVIELFQGDLGFPSGGFPKDLQTKVLRGRALTLDPSGEGLPPADMQHMRKEAEECLGRKAHSQDALSFVLYPHVFKEYGQHLQQFGDVSKIPTAAFLNGMYEGEEISVDLEPGKRLFITLNAVSEADDKGERTVFFELNGQTRSIVVRDKKIAAKDSGNLKADPKNPKHIAAPLAGALVAISVKPGQKIKPEDLLFTLEAMKMQSLVKASQDAQIKKVVAKLSTKVEVGDLIIELE